MGTNMVQFVKTHYPKRQGTPPFAASRVVLLVRNPFDAIESFFNLMMTGTHTTTITPEVREKTKKVWEEYVMKEIRVWIDFHDWWMSRDIPLLVIRYEDIVRDPARVMSRVIPFVLEVKRLVLRLYPSFHFKFHVFTNSHIFNFTSLRMNTFFSERIQRCIEEQAEIERMGSYKPRSGGIGKSLAKYSPELVAKIKGMKDLRKTMTNLGYKELLEKPVEEWVNLTQLENGACEFQPSGPGKTIVLNPPNRRLARGPNEVTPWQKIKIEFGIRDEDCNCEKCKALRARGSDNANAEEKKEEVADNAGEKKEEVNKTEKK